MRTLFACSLLAVAEGAALLLLPPIDELPAPVPVDAAAAPMLAEVRALQRRLRHPVREVRTAVQREEALQGEGDSHSRLQALETECAALLNSLAFHGQGPVALRCATAALADLAENESVPLASRLKAFGSLSSLSGGAAFLDSSLADAWLRDAHLLAGRDRLRSHIMDARHMAPRHAAVRSYLVATLLMGADDDLRNAAMSGLRNCNEPEVHEAMRTVASIPGSPGLRKQATVWLRTNQP